MALIRLEKALEVWINKNLAEREECLYTVHRTLGSNRSTSLIDS